MWIGVCLTCVLELVPERIRAASIGYYLFIITNIGGNIPLLVPPLKTAFAKASTELALRSKCFFQCCNHCDQYRARTGFK